MGCCGGEDDDTIDITKGGLVKKRGCTDILCLAVFIAFCGMWITLAGVAFQNGDPAKMIYPADSYGNLCGKDADYADKPFVLYYDFMECLSGGMTQMMLNGGRCPSHQQCVEKCPTEFWSYYLHLRKDMMASILSYSLSEEDISKLYCKPQQQTLIEDLRSGKLKGDAAKAKLDTAMELGQCSKIQLASKPIGNRCIPGSPDSEAEVDKTCDQSKAAAGNCTLTADLPEESYGMKEILADLKLTWRLIAVMLAAAIIVSLVWLVFLRFCGAVLVWIFVISFNLIFAGIATYSYFEWTRLKDLPAVGGGIFTMFENPKTWLTILIISGIIFGVIFLVTLFMIKRIRIATTILGEATKAVGDIPSTMIFPLWLAVLYCGVVTWYLAVATYTATAAVPIYRVVEKNASGWSAVAEGDECNIAEWNNETHASYEDTSKICVLDKFVDDYGWTNSTIIVQLIHLFGFYWSVNLVTGIGQVTLAGVYAIWYFARRKPQDIPKMPLIMAFRNVFFHLGSIAFGAFLIALIQTLRDILKYIEKKTKRYQNTFTKIIIITCKCCLWCMEKCMKFISKNAYIVIAIYGYGFCRSACKALKLIVMNAARAAAVSGVTNFCLLLGKLGISIGLTILAYILFEQDHEMKHMGALFEFLVPEAALVKSTDIVLLIVFVGSYAIANGFFKVYHMAISTIFLCFLEDLSRNDGSAQKPYFMSKSLMKVLGKKNAPETTNTTEVSKVKQK